MKASEVMTRGVVTVTPETPIAAAVQLMLDRHISGLPVVDASGVMRGIVTEGDFLRRAEMATERRRPRWLQFLRGTAQLADEYVRTHGRHVADVMTDEVQTVREETALDEVVALMERRRIKRVPVVDAERRLVGLVSRADLLRALLGCLPCGEAPPADDLTLRDHVVAELNRQEWAEDGRVTVTVTGGVVQLEGVVFDLRERDAMRVAAENVPGVKSVEEHLDFVDPNIGVIGVP